MPPRNPADRPATEPRTRAGKALHKGEMFDLTVDEDRRLLAIAIEDEMAAEAVTVTARAIAEAAQGAAPRAEGLDVERPMPFVQRVWPPFTNRDQELAQAFREAVAQAHYQATDHPVFPHPLVEDDDYNCPNEWCQRFWAMVREAEDRAGAAPRAEGLDAIAFLDSLRTPRNSLGKLALPKGHMEWAVEEAWVPPAVEELDDTGDGVMIHRLSELADLIIDRLQARLTEQEDRHD